METLLNPPPPPSPSGAPRPRPPNPGAAPHRTLEDQDQKVGGPSSFLHLATTWLPGLLGNLWPWTRSKAADHRGVSAPPRVASGGSSLRSKFSRPTSLFWTWRSSNALALLVISWALGVAKRQRGPSSFHHLEVGKETRGTDVRMPLSGIRPVCQAPHSHLLVSWGDPVLGKVLWSPGPGPSRPSTWPPPGGFHLECGARTVSGPVSLECGDRGAGGSLWGHHLAQEVASNWPQTRRVRGRQVGHGTFGRRGSGRKRATVQH